MLSGSIDLIWWVSVVDIPAMSGLFWMIWRVRQQSEEAVRSLQSILEARSMQLRDGLSAHKLEIAKFYARLSDLNMVEDRLTSHLLRIESKLDRTALKAEAIKSQSKTNTI